MNREEKIASRVAEESSKTAAYMATGYYKSLVGWKSEVMKKARDVESLASIILEDLQSPIGLDDKSHVMYNLGYLEGALDELNKDVEGMRSVVVDAGKAIRQHVS